MATAKMTTHFLVFTLAPESFCSVLSKWRRSRNDAAAAIQSE